MRGWYQAQAFQSRGRIHVGTLPGVLFYKICLLDVEQSLNLGKGQGTQIPTIAKAVGLASVNAHGSWEVIRQSARSLSSGQRM